MKGREKDHQRVIGEMRRILLDYLEAVAKWTKNRPLGQVIAAYWLVTALSTSGKSPMRSAATTAD
jgi:hypothetical protein